MIQKTVEKCICTVQVRVDRPVGTCVALATEKTLALLSTVQLPTDWDKKNEIKVIFHFITSIL